MMSQQIRFNFESILELQKFILAADLAFSPFLPAMETWKSYFYLF